MSNTVDVIANHATTSGTSNSVFPDDVQTIKAKNPKMDFSKPELLKLLCYMEGELQARDVVIAVLKVCLLSSRTSCLLISFFFSPRK